MSKREVASDVIGRAIEVWYGRALLGFIYGLAVSVLFAVVQINLWPESHESWFRKGDYFVMPFLAAALFVYPFTPLAMTLLERRFENFLAGIRGLFRRDRRKRR